MQMGDKKHGISCQYSLTENKISCLPNLLNQKMELSNFNNVCTVVKRVLIIYVGGYGISFVLGSEVISCYRYEMTRNG